MNITAVEASKGFIMIAARHYRTLSFVIVDNLGLYVKRIGRLIYEWPAMQETRPDPIVGLESTTPTEMGAKTVRMVRICCATSWLTILRSTVSCLRSDEHGSLANIGDLDPVNDCCINARRIAGYPRPRRMGWSISSTAMCGITAFTQ